MVPEGVEQLEQPILQLGAVGFDPSDRDRIAAVLASLPSNWTPWRLAAIGDADAWWVHGGNTRVLADGTLLVEPGHAQEAGLNLKLTSVDRPIAFSAPVTATEFEPHCVFALDDEAGMHSALHLFDTWLQPLHCLYVAGALVMRRGAELRHTVHHLNHRGTLQAVLDYRAGEVGILPTARPADLWAADWNRRPPTAHELPSNFIRYTPAQLLWTYVRRTERDLLPARYRSETIYFRHVPHVPPGWLRDPQRAVLQELEAQPSSFHQLTQRTGLAAAALALELSCLYYTGAITTTAQRSASRDPGTASRLGDSSGLASTLLRGTERRN